MRKILFPVLDFLLFSNLFMALCAVAQALVTLHLISSKATYPLLALLLTSTLCIYNFSILLSKPKFPEKSPFRRIRWYFAHNRLNVTITVISAIALGPLFFMLSIKSRLLLVGLSILSVGYSLPLFSSGKQKFGLRNIPGLKSLLITLVWTLSCVLLPIFEAESNHLAIVSFNDTCILVAKRFLFIGSLTIPFDIRDLFQDSRAGLKTIPVVFGQRKAYLFCQLLLAGYLVLLFLFRDNGFNRDFFALSLTTLLMGWLIFNSEWEKNEYYYFFYMDGVLILQYVLLMAFKFI
jgi:4-hydroxybenzoate polyprenyltransferase